MDGLAREPLGNHCARVGVDFISESEDILTTLIAAANVLIRDFPTIDSHNAVMILLFVLVFWAGIEGLDLQRL